MPVVFVYGVSDKVGEEKIVRVYNGLCAAILSIVELGLQRDQITFFFPPDRMKTGLGGEIIIFIEGLFEKPERTKEVKVRLARIVVSRAQDLFPEASLIECFVETFDPQKGFWSSVLP